MKCIRVSNICNLSKKLYITIVGTIIQFSNFFDQYYFFLKGKKYKMKETCLGCNSEFNYKYKESIKNHVYSYNKKGSECSNCLLLEKKIKHTIQYNSLNHEVYFPSEFKNSK
jgi:uncharacterized protein with PIN domain